MSKRKILTNEEFAKAFEKAFEGVDFDEQPAQHPVGPSGDSLSDFQADQWWVRELDAAVANGTHDQKRAVAVVRNMIATAQAHLEAQPSKPLTDEQFLELILRTGTVELVGLTTFVGGSIQMQGKIGLLRSAKIIKEFVEAAHGIKE